MDEGLLEQKRKIFESFAETCLRPYIRSVVAKRKKYNYKVFNDPVWHSILLYPIEIIVLDSPLLQRLRRIRQLGVAHWVYPGAEHKETSLFNKHGNIYIDPDEWDKFWQSLTEGKEAKDG